MQNIHQIHHSMFTKTWKKVMGKGFMQTPTKKIQLNSQMIKISFQNCRKVSHYVWHIWGASPPHCILLPFVFRVIGLCRPPRSQWLHEYIKLIDERFIRLMGSAGAEKHPPTKQDLKYKQNNKVARRQLHQQFDMNNFPDVGETV